MTDIVSIPLDQIHVPQDYVRRLDEGAAQRLARLIEREGQKAPIAVYRSTARQGGEKPYTLIYGARRLRAMAIIGRDGIDAILRTKAEARRLQIMDNLATTSLDELEGAEYLAAYRELWEAEFGPVRRGGDRRSKVHREPLIRDLQFLEKHNFFNHINEELGIKPGRAKRLLAISRLDKGLRDAIRGTQWAKDQKYLKKLTKFSEAAQVGIAVAMKLEPDLEAVLRTDDPATGRKGVGRMETGDWRKRQFVEAWENMPREIRAAALAAIGAMTKPLDPWPAELTEVLAVPAPDNNSPLWAMTRDPYRTLYRPLTYEEIEAAKREQAEEDQRAASLRDEPVFRKMTANEQETRPAHAQMVAKAKAKKSRKPRPGRPPYTPEIRRRKDFEKWFIADLARSLLERDPEEVTLAAVKFCRTLNADEQFSVACHLGNGHAVQDIWWRIAKDREARGEDGRTID